MNRDRIRAFIGPSADTWTDAELEEAENNLRAYVELAWRIFERLEREEASLTPSEDGLTIESKGPSASTSIIDL